MARLILKAPYYKPLSRVPSGPTRGGYANYIATREGVEIPPQRESIKDYHRITCEKGKYLAKQPPILRNEPTSSQKTMNQTVKTMHRIALVFAMESCMKNAWKSTQTQRMQSCFFAMV